MAALDLLKFSLHEENIVHSLDICVSEAWRGIRSKKAA